jgi:nicotinamide riboside kinase
MRIAIIGAQCTGKTTLIEAIRNQAILPIQYKYTSEVVRSLVKSHNIKINQDGDFRSQLLVFQAHWRNVLKFDWMVTDRSCIDAWVYTLYNHSKGFFSVAEMDSLERLFNKTVARYDKIFYLPVEVPLVSDDFRSMNDGFRQEIDNLFFFILHHNKIQYTPLVGTVDTRVKTFKNYL